MTKQGAGRAVFLPARRRRGAARLALAGLALAELAAAAVVVATLTAVAVAAEPAPPAGHKAELRQNEAAAALAAAEHEAQLSAARSAALKAELQALGRDQKRLSRALAAAAKAERVSMGAIAAGIEHLRALAAQEGEERTALAARQAETAEILAGLEKLSLNPPPFMFVRAADRRQSLQAAALLGTLLPQMQSKAAAVQERLAALQQVEIAVNATQEDLHRAREQQAGEHMRLSLLLEKKKQLQQQKQKNWREEEKKYQSLAEKAQNLQDLLGEISKQAPPSGRSAPAGQLQVEVPFSSLRGLLPRPVAGRLVLGFGEKTAGKPSQGEIMETAPAAIITAPAEGVVRYAGRFRSYGQLVIIDAGEDYYLILAGMAQIHVAPEQFLLQGEPVGNMENLLLADKGGLMINKAAPRLYLEIRQAGRPVDPALWWVPAGRQAH